MVHLRATALAGMLQGAPRQFVRQVVTLNDASFARLRAVLSGANWKLGQARDGVLQTKRAAQVQTSKKLRHAYESVVQAKEAVLVWINGRYVLVVTKLRIPGVTEKLGRLVPGVRRKVA